MVGSKVRSKNYEGTARTKEEGKKDVGGKEESHGRKEQLHQTFRVEGCSNFHLRKIQFDSQVYGKSTLSTYKISTVIYMAFTLGFS